MHICADPLTRPPPPRHHPPIPSLCSLSLAAVGAAHPFPGAPAAARFGSASEKSPQRATPRPPCCIRTDPTRWKPSRPHHLRHRPQTRAQEATPRQRPALAWRLMWHHPNSHTRFSLQTGHGRQTVRAWMSGWLQMYRSGQMKKGLAACQSPARRPAGTRASSPESVGGDAGGRGGLRQAPARLS
jgi:hypothetical protein